MYAAGGGGGGAMTNATSVQTRDPEGPAEWHDHMPRGAVRDLGAGGSGPGGLQLRFAYAAAAGARDLRIGSPAPGLTWWRTQWELHDEARPPVRRELDRDPAAVQFHY